MEMWLPAQAIHGFLAGVVGFVLFISLLLLFLSIYNRKRNMHTEAIRNGIEERLIKDFPGVKTIDAGNCVEVVLTLKSGATFRAGGVPVRRNMTPHQVRFVIDKYSNLFGKVFDKIKGSREPC